MSTNTSTSIKSINVEGVRVTARNLRAFADRELVLDEEALVQYVATVLARHMGGKPWSVNYDCTSLDDGEVDGHFYSSTVVRSNKYGNHVLGEISLFISVGASKIAEGWLSEEG